MPLPSDAARVSLLAESSEDESSEANEISAPRVSSDDPGRKANPLAHAPDAELDALVRALRSKKPSDRTKLEAEEREAARARVRVELVSHVHRMKRGGVVAFPANLDADAAANAEAQRVVRRGRSGEEPTREGDDAPSPFDPALAARMRRELRETGTVSSGPAAAAADPRDDDGADADDDADDAGHLRDLDGSFERFRVTVDELVRPREEPKERVEKMIRRESDETAFSAEPETSSDGERKDARDAEDPENFFDASDDAHRLALAAIDAKLAAAAVTAADASDTYGGPTNVLREETKYATTFDLSNDTMKPERSNSFEPFGGDDAEQKLASVDARLKTFASRLG